MVLTRQVPSRRWSESPGPEPPAGPDPPGPEPPADPGSPWHQNDAGTCPAPMARRRPAAMLLPTMVTPGRVKRASPHPRRAAGDLLPTLMTTLMARGRRDGRFHPGLACRRHYTLDRPSAPGSGMLDLTIPLAALAGLSAEPGTLSRLGPVTAPEARDLAVLATLDPAVRWRIILTDNTGRAIAVARVPRVSARSGPWAGDGRSAMRPASEARHAGLLGRVTIIIPESILNPASPDQFDEFASGGSPRRKPGRPPGSGHPYG